MKSFKGSLAGLALAGILALAPAAAFGHPGGGGGFGGGGGGGHFGGGGGNFGGGGGHFGGGGGHFASAGHFAGGHFGGGHFGGGHFAGFTGRGFAGHQFIADRGGRFTSHDGHSRDRDHFRHDRNFFFGVPYGYDYPYYGYGYYPYDYYPYGYYGYYSDDSNGYADTTNAVIAVQQELARLGYYHGSVDGVLGPETEKAIRWFQSVDKLPVTGHIDDTTLSALRVG